MTVFKEYPRYDAMGLAQLIASGEVSAAEVAAAARYFIGKLNPDLNAFVAMLDAPPEAGLDVAAPFSGVPMAVKDCVAGIAGVRQTYGSRLCREEIAEQDEEVIARYRAAGFIFCGQTNVPEFSSSITTEPALFGRCNNPWNPGLTVGGSSGGSGCAVAAGMVPVATGNDSLGSIRIPASCNGVFGFKPSRGRVPNGPRYSEIWNGLFVQHALTRSVRDSAALLDIAQGLDAGAPYTAPAPARPYLGEVHSAPAPLKIAFTTRASNAVAVDDECRQAVDIMVGRLQDLGHRVEEASPGLDGRALFALLEDMIAVNFCYEATAYAHATGQVLGEENLEACNLQLVARGRALPALRLMQFLEMKGQLERALGGFFGDYDVLLSPTLATPPVAHGYISAQSTDLETYLARMRAFSPFVGLANVCGLPSMSVPSHWTAQGIPVGTLFTGPYGDEATLFRLAGQIEQAMPWSGRHPPISAWNLN